VLTFLLKIVAKPGLKEELVELLIWDADVAAREEPGTLRFDVYDVPGEPDAVLLYETYADEAAFEAHKAGAPFQKFMGHIVPNVVERFEFTLRDASPLTTNARP
jgi:quinol monooxygenase YgiN